MASDISIAMKIAIILLLAGALLSTVLTVSIPMTKWLLSETNKTIVITDITYNQLKGTKGMDMNAGRIYRYYMETEDKIGCIAVREHPITSPADYKILMCKERTAVTPAIQSKIDSLDWSNPEKNNEEYMATSSYFNHDRISKDFRVTVNVFPDGGLEILCDMTDEFYD